METENGVFEEDEKGTTAIMHEEDSVINEKQDQHSVDSGDKAIDVAIVEEEKSVDVPESKMSNSFSSSNGGSLRSDKAVANNQDNEKGRVPLASNTKRGLSQNLSFPAKGVRHDATKKSVDGLLVKDEAKSNRASGSKPGGKNVNGSVSVSRLNQSTKRAAAGVNSKENVSGSSSRRATIASVPSFRRSSSGKSGSVNGPAKAASSVVSLSVEKQLTPVKISTLIKEDEDTRSTTSSNASEQRRGESGFSFRLNERAEKRKEFFSKLEEKMQAKEAEKTNMQVKTMENQEAEIKQLRKSLTFKATPMPSFYKEPPAKVELRKIPTTRPKSPKLGRNKSFTPTKPNPPEGGESNEGESVEAIRATSGKDAASTSKKPVKKSATKLQSHKQASVKETSADDTKPGAERMEENESNNVDSCEIKDETKDERACELEIQATEVAAQG